MSIIRPPAPAAMCLKPQMFDTSGYLRGMPMNDFLRHQIESARNDRDRRAVAARVSRSCWPGGLADRSEPAALDWLRRWWPERIGVSIPPCTCQNGHCPVCN